MLREEWEKSEDAESILLIYNHVTMEATSEIFSGYECGFKVRAREEELAERFPALGFGIIDNEVATEQWLTVVLQDFYEDMGLDEDDPDEDINFS